jgi:hypothetical protein
MNGIRVEGFAMSHMLDGDGTVCGLTGNVVETEEVTCPLCKAGSLISAGDSLGAYSQAKDTRYSRNRIVRDASITAMAIAIEATVCG